MSHHNTQRYHSMRDAYNEVYLKEGKIGAVANILGKGLGMAKKAGKAALSSSGDEDNIADSPDTQKEAVSIMPMGRVPMVVKQTTNIDLELTPEYKGPGEVSKAYYTYPAGFDPTGRQDVVKDQSHNGSEKRSEKKVEEEYVSEGGDIQYPKGPKQKFTKDKSDPKVAAGREAAKKMGLKMNEDEYSDLELVCDFLLHEGLVETMEGAEAFWNHMSESYKESLLEAGRCWKGYKPTPGKKAYSNDSCTKEQLDKFVHELVSEGHDLSGYTMEQVTDWYQAIHG